MNFARLGFALDWKRISREACRLHSLSVKQTVTPADFLHLGFEVREYFYEAALFNEIRLQSLRKARSMKREAREQGRRLAGAVALACTPEGQHMQRIIDTLSYRISEREAVLLCG